MEINKIKLIIWDLDETLWNGVLSDGTSSIDARRLQLIRDLTDAGVINAVCSKNEFAEAERFLREQGIWELFVFNSINWSSKGERVKQIITEMALRDVNVLFIDDNRLNLEEAKAACPGIMTGSPEAIEELIEYFKNAPKKDIRHTRLEQYKVLEKKKEFKATVGSNEEFLRSCNIQVEIKYDCENQLGRIAELVLRSNQLNFTKVRSSEKELSELFSDGNVKCGYVEVRDSFGDYGIVGFFALRNNVCEHFVFSCRTLNMGVEQFVYNELGRPQITVTGEVASSLEAGAPDWINRSSIAQTAKKQQLGNTKILLKGPCDLSLVFSFINDSGNIIKEFVYVNDRGVSIESGNHTEHILQSLTLDENTKTRLAQSLPFGDTDMYKTRMFDEDIGAVYFSTFTDPNLGLYREKESGAVVAFGEWTNDLTDETNWEGFIKNELFTSNCVFTRESLADIRERFEFLGRITPEKTVENLDAVYSQLSKQTKLILNLGSEIEYENNTQPAYKDRHLYHRELNTLIREWKKDKDNVYLIGVTDFIKSQSDYTNNINHFVKTVYYYMARELVNIINDDSLSVRRHQRMKLSKRIKKAVKKLLRINQ